MKVGEPFSIASRIEQAFQSASTTTGTSFDYLVRTARRESNFDEDAKAGTSSASGLFQFIESTWLETVKQSGHKHGLGHYAEQISRTSSGRYKVSDPAMRREILALRDNAEVASVMAGELTRKNSDYLTAKLGRQPNQGELYIAHFLGAGGANKLIRLAETQPALSADQVFSRQAKANRSIFYERDGSPRSVAAVYANLVAKHGGTSAPVTGATQVAALPTSKADALPGRMEARAGASVPANLDIPASGLSMGDPTRRVLNAWSATDDVSSPFHALFRNGVEAKRASLNATFLTAFAAQEAGQRDVARQAFSREADASGTDAYSARRTQILARADVGSAPVPVARESRPMDLTGFLSYRPALQQKDLLPPA